MATVLMGYRVKRPEPEALGADGKPIKPGDTVHTPGGTKMTVRKITGDMVSAGLPTSDRAHAHIPARLLSHTPPVHGSDGKPVKLGDTVYLDDEHAGLAGQAGYDGNWSYGLIGVETGEALTVARVDSDSHVHLVEHGAWCPASWLTHDAPDTQERIDEDARKSACYYFGYGDKFCEDEGGCPANYRDRSEFRICRDFVVADLLRRQRELDAKATGGAR